MHISYTIQWGVHVGSTSLSHCMAVMMSVFSPTTVLAAYSHFIDEDMQRPGPKFLPLGRSFQEQVAIFKLVQSALPS